MKTTVERKPKVKFPVDTLSLFAFEGDNRPSGQWEKIDIRLQQKYRAAAENEGFMGREKQVLVFYPDQGKPAKRVVVAGLGKKTRVDAERIRRAASCIIRRLRDASVEETLLLLPVEQKLDVDVREQAQAAVEAAALTLYRFDRYRKPGKDADGKGLERLRLVAVTERHLREMTEGARLGEIYARGTSFTRDLVNEPAAAATPAMLAESAKKIARGRPRISVKVFDPNQIRKMGMGALLAVAAGSDQPCRFVHMTYKAPGAKRTIAVVGKGITFDSGGLCLKPADGMLRMKVDMAGAAAVLGVFEAISDLKPKLNVHGIFAATENATGGSAYKPSDILRAMNGKTIEVINTDAEGRLILADALSYASRLKPHEIVDMATLTGACVVALGTRISGILGTDQALIDRIIAAGRQAGEKIWQLPLEDEYFEMIKTDVADMKNSGGVRWGGAITAALLLKQFVSEDISWAHLDIAGEVFSDKGEHYNPPGASGAMVRTILRYLSTRG